MSLNNVYPLVMINNNPKIYWEKGIIFPLPIVMAAIIWSKDTAPVHINCFTQQLTKHGIISLIIEEDENYASKIVKMQKADIIIIADEEFTSDDADIVYIQGYAKIKPTIPVSSMMKLIFSKKQK